MTICNNVCCVSNVSLTLIISIENLLRSLAQLVSTSNKRSSSGEMKKRPEEGDIYREIIFDTYGSKNLNCEN